LGEFSRSHTLNLTGARLNAVKSGELWEAPWSSGHRRYAPMPELAEAIEPQAE
jgi:hypothetical protein